MRRREILAGIALAAAGPPARAQSPTGMPTIGYLSGRGGSVDAELVDAFERGLGQTGFIKGRNVIIDYRSAEGRANRLPALAAELVRRNATLIFASSTASTIAAKAATTTIPIVFAGASDPVRLGLVASLNNPGGNVTGVTMFAHAFGPKRLQLLIELVPRATVIGILVNPGNPSAAVALQELNAAADALGIDTVVLEARTAEDIDAAFATLADRHLRALYILDDSFFSGRADRISSLALRQSVGLISTLRAYPRAGGLASYGADFAEVHRQCGIYAGRILKGAQPADLPVMLPTKFELAINLATAKALGIEIPPTLLARAEEVIE